MQFHNSHCKIEKQLKHKPDFLIYRSNQVLTFINITNVKIYSFLTKFCVLELSQKCHIFDSSEGHYEMMTSRDFLPYFGIYI